MTLRGGAAAAAVYVVVALLTAAAGGRLLPLYDGLDEHPPYRWVRPPVAGLDLGAPRAARESVPVHADGSPRVAVATADGQAVVLLRAGAIPPSPGERAALVRIRPLDPAALGPAPTPTAFEGNAYEVSARYVGSGREVGLAVPAVVTLRYPAHADTLLAWRRNRWQALAAGTVPAAQELYAEADEWGTFAMGVAAAPPRRDPRLALALGALALALAAEARSRRRRRAGGGVSPAARS